MYKNKLSWLITTSLKGISQVILIDNAVSGFIILAAITIASYSLGIITLFSSIIGTLIGKFCGAEKDSINQGLYGYNSVLTGIALFFFLRGDDRWLIALAGSAIAAIFTAVMIHIMRQSGIPILTFPFIILTWLLLLLFYKQVTFRISTELAPHTLSNWTLSIGGKINWLDGTVNGIGQIFFLDYTLSGILLFLSVFWAGWRLGVYAIIGDIAALLTSYGLGGEQTLISKGLYGYNAILTMLAVSIVFKGGSRYAFLTGIIAACLTVPITASVVTWPLPYGFPALTMPFVLCTWIFVAAKKVLPKV